MKIDGIIYFIYCDCYNYNYNNKGKFIYNLTDINDFSIIKQRMQFI